MSGLQSGRLLCACELGPLGFSVPPFSAPWRAHLRESRILEDQPGPVLCLLAHSPSPAAGISVDTVSSEQ